MKFVLLFLVFTSTLCLAFLEGQEALHAFNRFKSQHGKVYDGHEHDLRFEIFKQNLRVIEGLNAKSKGATFGITKFADLTEREFKEMHLMKESERQREMILGGDDVLPVDRAAAVPADLDWRAKGAVTPIKDQGQCGSCWAFSTIENVESMWILAGKATNTTLQLSPQQVVDCDTTDAGCNGGDPPSAYQYIINAGGLESEAAYPYHASDGQCKFQKNKVVATISSWKYATNDRDEKVIQQALANWGPLSICVDAANWQHYTGGVMTAWDCAWIVQLDHCVQLVGYETTGSGKSHWIVRNSWGTGWGVNGYIYLTMFENTCGMAQEATSSVI